ncbi:VOC family protein [Mycolicibacter heraklionensis]|uniref:VOC family protein n=1 Tax=Mycolicibacter heraklionensis TaxID=512402 RepID=A0A9X7ZGR6_9MYCO|nr:VOC family protein [Mycolicibacter heraklionensis]QZA08240.1 VOC family protein [Mycolicibacter heraklionensis]
MIDHVGINCSDYAKSQKFYDAVLDVLGYTRQMDVGVAVGYGRDGKPTFWIADAGAGDASGPNREVHVAFSAADINQVQAFYDTAVGQGAESLHAPRLWPEYHPGYFGAFVRDPDGNNVEAVCHQA